MFGTDLLGRNFLFDEVLAFIISILFACNNFFINKAIIIFPYLLEGQNC